MLEPGQLVRVLMDSRASHPPQLPAVSTSWAPSTCQPVGTGHKDTNPNAPVIAGIQTQTEKSEISLSNAAWQMSPRERRHRGKNSKEERQPGFNSTGKGLGKGSEKAEHELVPEGSSTTTRSRRASSMYWVLTVCWALHRALRLLYCKLIHSFITDPSYLSGTVLGTPDRAVNKITWVSALRTTERR